MFYEIYGLDVHFLPVIDDRIVLRPVPAADPVIIRTLLFSYLGNLYKLIKIKVH